MGRSDVQEARMSEGSGVPMPTVGDAPPERRGAGEAISEPRFGERLILAEGPPAGHRWRGWGAAVAGLLGLAAVGAHLYVRLAHAQVPVAPSLPAPDPVTAAPTPEPPRPRGERAPAQRDAAIATSAPRREHLPLPAPSDFTVRRRVLERGSDGRVAVAYAALLRGDVAGARTAYEEVLNAEPDNRPAHLGAAAVAAREGDRARARLLYLRLLERDPADPVALAGFIDQEPTAEGTARAARVKGLIALHPEEPALHALLGRLHAHAQRWPEARQAFAQALALQGRDSGGRDPDLAFNLAVALEHTGQRSEALAHYRVALQWAGERAPLFDRAAAEARVRALTGG